MLIRQLPRLRLRLRRTIAVLALSLALAGIAVPLPAVATTATLGVGISAWTSIPGVAGNADGYPLTVKNSGTATEAITLGGRAVSGATLLPTTFLSPGTFTLDAGASCVAVLRYTVPDALVGTFAKVSLTASATLAEATNLSGISLTTTSSVALTATLQDPSKTASLPISALPNTATPICGLMGQTIVSPRFGFSSVRKTVAQATFDQYVLSNPTATPISVSFGAPLSQNSMAAPTQAYLGGGAAGWTVPASGKCVVKVALSNLLVGQYAKTYGTATTALGTTGGQASYRTYTDLSIVATKAMWQFYNPAATTPLCAPAN